MTYNVADLIERLNGDERLVALIDGGMQRRRCGWCERELRPCNMRRHVAAAHFRQLTLDDALAESGQKKMRRGGRK